MKLKLKKWVKVVLIFLFLMFWGFIIIGWFTKKEVVITEGKNYTCVGFKVIQLCSGVDYDIK